MLDAKIRGLWDRAMRPVGRALGRTPLSPNAVTLLGVAIHAVVAALILDGRFLAAGVAAAAGALFDGLDGALAKAQGRTSRFGALLDSTTDRVSDALIFLALAWFYAVEPDAGHEGERWVAAVALAALVFSFLVSYVKARAEGLGFECQVGIAERAERLILVIVGLVFDVLPVTLSLLALLAAITFVQRLVHVRSQIASAA